MCHHSDPEPGLVEEVVLGTGHQGLQTKGRLWPDKGYDWELCSSSVCQGAGGCRACEPRAVRAGAGQLQDPVYMRLQLGGP